MSNLNNLMNYYIENDYLNLTNNINYDDLILLINGIKKYNIIITTINVPSDFKYLHMGNSQFKSNTYIREANILRTQRC